MVVFYWTINNKADMKLLIESGADGVITDRPDLLQEVLLGY
jgi:glycerophosphoryl diester phosphodiesterase